MKAKELTELLSKADPESEIIFCVEQYNKAYPVAYLDVGKQYPVAIQNDSNTKRVLLCGMLPEGAYVAKMPK